MISVVRLVRSLSTASDFDTVTRSQSWYQFASTRRLQHELSKPESTRLAAMAVLFHMRLTRPLLGVILVLMMLFRRDGILPAARQQQVRQLEAQLEKVGTEPDPTEAAT